MKADNVLFENFLLNRPLPERSRSIAQPSSSQGNRGKSTGRHQHSIPAPVVSPIQDLVLADTSQGYHRISSGTLKAIITQLLRWLAESPESDQRLMAEGMIDALCHGHGNLVPAEQVLEELLSWYQPPQNSGILSREDVLLNYEKACGPVVVFMQRWLVVAPVPAFFADAGALRRGGMTGTYDAQSHGATEVHGANLTPLGRKISEFFSAIQYEPHRKRLQEVFICNEKVRLQLSLAFVVPTSLKDRRRGGGKSPKKPKGGIKKGGGILGTLRGKRGPTWIDGVFGTVNIQPQKIADHLYWLDSQLFRNVPPQEWYASFESPIEGGCPFRAVMIQRNAALAHFVVKTFLARTRDHAELFKGWIQIAWLCYQRGNFFSAFSIQLGLEDFHLRPLEGELLGLKGELRTQFEEMSRIVNDLTFVQAYTKHQAALDAERPMIPHLVQMIKYLDDIRVKVTAQLGSSTNLINFDLIYERGKIVADLIKAQRLLRLEEIRSPPTNLNPDVSSFLQTLPFEMTSDHIEQRYNEIRALRKREV